MDMDSHSASDSSEGPACKISMLWNWTTIDACFISSDWHVRSDGAFAATCISVIVIAVTLEGLRRAAREYDEHIVREFRAGETATAMARATPGGAVLRFSPGFGQQLVRAALHVATFAVAYMLMLMAMYYNGYVILCIFLGAGVGKFLFDWMGVMVVVGGAKARDGKLGGRTIDEPTVCCG